ncbi:MAG: endonuclease III [Nanoarchaeota archaeon]
MNRRIAIKQFVAIKKLEHAPMRLAAESWKKEWQILISTLLSARTRDEITIPVAESLFKRYSNIEMLANANIADLRKIIHSVNFYKTKAKNVSECAKLIVNRFNKEAPHTVEELITLPGVGRKTANVFLSELGYNTIGVDTHLAQISIKLGWTNNKSPHKIEKDLLSLFPKRYWKELNPVCVRFGKTHTKRAEWNSLLDKIRTI